MKRLTSIIIALHYVFRLVYSLYETSNRDTNLFLPKEMGTVNIKQVDTLGSSHYRVSFPNLDRIGKHFLIYIDNEPYLKLLAPKKYYNIIYIRLFDAK